LISHQTSTFISIVAVNLQVHKQPTKCIVYNFFVMISIVMCIWLLNKQINKSINLKLYVAKCRSQSLSIYTADIVMFTSEYASLRQHSVFVQDCFYIFQRVSVSILRYTDLEYVHGYVFHPVASVCYYKAPVVYCNARLSSSTKYLTRSTVGRLTRTADRIYRLSFNLAHWPIISNLFILQPYLILNFNTRSMYVRV
jgi:hypothetical protein